MASGTNSCNTSGQLLVNPGFESASSGWTASAGVLANIAADAHSGSDEAWLDGYGSSHTDTLYQSVTIPSGVCTATFSFWRHILTSERTTTNAYDVLTVTVSNNSGATVLATYSNLNASTAYVQESFNLAAYAGQTAKLEFSGTEDSSCHLTAAPDLGRRFRQWLFLWASAASGSRRRRLGCGSALDSG